MCTHICTDLANGEGVVYQAVNDQADSSGRVGLTPVHKDDTQELHTESSKSPRPEASRHRN